MNSTKNYLYALGFALMALAFNGLTFAQEGFRADPTYAPVPESRVDINTADQELLLKLGLKPEEAQAVLKHRAKHGPLKDERELSRVRGLSAQSFQRIRGKVQFSIEASTQSA